MIKRRSLEMALEKLAKPKTPHPELEQYTTPATIASDLLWTALSYGDIQGKKVADLGCGNGILGIGAAQIGASTVSCYDSDPEMVSLCRSNALAAGATINVICADISSIIDRFDSVVQNPPFGAQRRGADRPFLQAAIRISNVTYSLHLAETTDFVAEFCRSLGADAQHIKNYKFEIPFMFKFHNKPVELVDVALLRIVVKR